MDLYRENFIKTKFDNKDQKDLAEANMELKYNKDLTEEEIDGFKQQRDAAIENMDHYTQFIDPITGDRMSLPKAKETYWVSQGYISNEKNINKEKQELETKIKQSKTPFKVLEEAVQFNALALFQKEK